MKTVRQEVREIVQRTGWGSLSGLRPSFYSRAPCGREEYERFYAVLVLIFMSKKPL